MKTGLPPQRTQQGNKRSFASEVCWPQQLPERQRREGFFVGKTAITVQRRYGKCSPPSLCVGGERRLSSEFFSLTTIAPQSLLPLTQGQWRACLFAIMFEVAPQSLLPLTQGQWRACLFAIKFEVASQSLLPPTRGRWRASSLRVAKKNCF